MALKKNLEDSIHSMTDVIVLLLGIILLLAKIIVPTLIEDLFQALGTALFAAGLVSMLLQRFKTKKDHNTVRILTANRQTLSDKYKKRKYNAQKVEILSIALSEALEELVSDQKDILLRKVLLEGVHVKLMFLSPKSLYVKQRALEDSAPEKELSDNLVNSVKKVRVLSSKFNDLFENLKDQIDPTKIGSFEIRVIDHCPHFTTYRTNDKILWGLYTSQNRGTHSAVISVEKANETLFKQLNGHFESIWNSIVFDLEKGDNYLFKYHFQLGSKYNDNLERELLA